MFPAQEKVDFAIAFKKLFFSFEKTKHFIGKFVGKFHDYTAKRRDA